MTMMAAISIAALTAACSSSSSPSGASSASAAPIAVVPATNPGIPAPAIAAKELQGTKTAAGYSALDRGILTYTPLTTLVADTPVEFYVTVIDVGRGPQLTSAPTKYHGQAVDPYDVATSAGVEVQLVCSSDLECQDQSSQDGQIVNPQQGGYWRWSVTALNPGTAFIGVIAVTYEEDTGTFIHSTPLWTIPLKVQAAGA